MEPNPVPTNPPQGYFNYDINDENYGPDVWDRVDTSNHYMREFGPDGFGAWKDSLQDDPTENRCTTSGTRQSPKDLVQEDGIIIAGDGNDGICDAGHEIRTRVSRVDDRLIRSFSCSSVLLLVARAVLSNVTNRLLFLSFTNRSFSAARSLLAATCTRKTSYPTS